jgi:hypothetical protein
MFIRSEKSKANPYVMVNKQFVSNSNLSWKAKGILLYLLSLPDDWCINEQELQRHSTDGRDSLSSGVRELIKEGYIERKKTRSANGKFDNWEYIVSEESTENGKSDCGKTEYGEPTTTNNKLLNIDVTKYKEYESADKSTVKKLDSDILACMKLYMEDYYNQKFKRKHPFLKGQQFQEVHDKLKDFCDSNSIDSDTMQDMMLKYFNCRSITSNRNINSFATEGIMQNFLMQVM